MKTPGDSEYRHMEVPLGELQQALARSLDAPLAEADYRKLAAALDTLAHLTQLLAAKDTTIRDLRQLLFPAATEKTRNVFPNAGSQAAAAGPPQHEQKKKKPGHGRNAAAAYQGARRVRTAHPTLKTGDPCPACEKGKLYTQQEAKVLVRIVGQAPIAATVYEMERLRCNLCGEIFTAPTPAEAGGEQPRKYDETAAAMMATLRYGGGMPLNRLKDLEASLGIPLPASTQWGIVEEVAQLIQPAHDELIRQAAQGEVLHNDDTSMKVLSLRPEKLREDSSRERTGVFTSGIVSTQPGRRIALFFTGRQHAGENLSEVLERRAAQLAPPIQMCDALSRNLKLPAELEVIVGHCLAHGRRRFVAVAENFPAPCRHVLEQLGAVYANDALARQRGLSPQQRLRFHQQRSQPVLDELEVWLQAQLAEKRVEPNSGLGTAINYLLKHWERLTLFLRQAGAPLDNNICERALKKAILHRKNSLFYKTQNGARVGDLFMSLIHTAELCGANPFDYLTELQRHAEELTAAPAQWMPWNYRQALERSGVPSDCQ
jgi:transposase